VTSSLTNQSVKCWLVTGRQGSGLRKHFGVPFIIRPPSRMSAMFTSASLVAALSSGCWLKRSENEADQLWYARTIVRQTVKVQLYTAVETFIVTLWNISVWFWFGDCRTLGYLAQGQPGCAACLSLGQSLQRKETSLARLLKARATGRRHNIVIFLFLGTRIFAWLGYCQKSAGPREISLF